MKMDYEIIGKTWEFTSNFSNEIPNKFIKLMEKNKIDSIIFGDKYNVFPVET